MTHPNIYFIYRLLELMKGPVLEIFMIQGNNRIEMNLGEDPVI